MASLQNTQLLCKYIGSLKLYRIIIIFLSIIIFPSFSNFWKIVREFDETQKKQLLAFVTGSDRIPLGGLAKLKFIIVKNGPDSDRYSMHELTL